jgi:hypothetical protein
LGIGDWAQSPIPNPQSPIPNPHEYHIILKRINKQIKTLHILTLNLIKLKKFK